MAIGEHEILTLVLHVMWEKTNFPSFLISSLQLKTFTHTFNTISSLKIKIFKEIFIWSIKIKSNL
jgi:hypothetical protein